jgi:hypothetical protein
VDGQDRCPVLCVGGHQRRWPRVHHVRI